MPEQVLWSYLRGRRLSGLKFRRQVPVEGFIADFYCAEKRLIVELDGESHVGRADYDEKRTRVLEHAGYQVLRFTNDDLLEHPEAVADAILNAFEDKSRTTV